MRRFVSRRVLQFHEVVFIGAVINIRFIVKRFAALGTGLPITGMPFVVVAATKREAAVIARATIPRVGEEDIVALVVANPLAAALGLDELGLLAAQPATWGVGIRFL